MDIYNDPSDVDDVLAELEPKMPASIWPERFTPEQIEQLMRVYAADNSMFKDLYQQRPMVPTGGDQKSETVKYRLDWNFGVQVRNQRSILNVTSV